MRPVIEKEKTMTGKSSHAVYAVTAQDGHAFQLTLKGRNRWAMQQLIRAGQRGCTPIDNPAPRWSAYIFNLRKFGVEIETVSEPHGGKYSGTHARYVLRSDVWPMEEAV